MILDDFTIETLLDYVKNNSSTALLFVFTVLQCINVIYLLFKKEISAALMNAAVYFPTLVMLIADVFYGLSWNGLTGYVLGISITLSLAIFNNDGKNLKEVASKASTTILLCLHLIFG